MSEDLITRLKAALEGRYTIEGELGAGGMATVYLANDERHDRQVAVKVLKPELAAVIGAERFISEIKTTARLQHPHILPLFDSGEADGFLFYVMPFVEGESLRDRLDTERQLSVDESLRITMAVAGALQYAHEHDIIHRDIKPENILLHSGEPVVADFGIALAVSAAGGGRMTETGLSLGTPHYMSPEQATADRDLSARSDVYSLACVLYEMLAGDPPHIGPTSQSILMRILTEEPRPVTEVRRSVPRNVASALTKALEKLPADRFDSAEDFRKALQEEAFRYTPMAVSAARPGVRPAGAGDPALGGAMTQPLDPTYATAGIPGAPTVEAAATPAPDRRFQATAAVAALATAAALWGWLRSPATVDLPVTRVALATGEGRVAPAFGNNFAISPDGADIVFVAQAGASRQLFRRRADDTEVRPIPDTDAASEPVFSPDGDWILFGASGGLRKMAADGGPSLTVVQDIQASNPHWGVDGNVYFRGSDGLYTVPSSGGDPSPLLLASDAGQGGSLRYPELLPDGKAVVYSVNPPGGVAEGSIWLLELATGESTQLVREGEDALYVSTGHLVYGHVSQTLFAVPFDAGRHEVTGPPTPVVEGVAVFGGGASQFAFSRTGTLVYLTATGGTGSGFDLVVIGLDGEQTTLPLDAVDPRTPRYSPDGGSIAYRDEQDIYVYDLSLGTNTRLTFEGFNMDPIWSRDGSKLTIARRAEEENWTIARIRVDGSGEPEVLLDEPGTQTPQDWSPDESLLVVRDLHDSRGDDLYLLSEGDSGLGTSYLQADWDEEGAVVSPDGHWLAYYSDESGTDEVYVRAFPEPEGKWQVSENGGLTPVWSPEGDKLYYVGGNQLHEVSVQREPVFRVLQRGVAIDVFNIRFNRSFAGYGLHPDGHSVIAVQQGGGSVGGVTVAASAQETMVVVNWFEELKARMRN